MSFANLAMWHEAYGTQFAFDSAGRLILYSPVEKMIYFPRGAEISPAELADLSSIFARNGMTDNCIYDIPDSYIDQHPDAEKYFTLDSNEDNFDYLFDNQHLADCAGSKLRKKRNLIKQFLAAYPQYEIIELDPAFTLDGKCVVLHDKTLNRTCRRNDGETLPYEIKISDAINTLRS